MSDLRRESLKALGRQLDDLEARADEFLAQPRPPKPAWTPGELPGVLAALDAAKARPSHLQLQSRRPQSSRGRRCLAGAELVPSRGVRLQRSRPGPSLPTDWARRTTPSTTGVFSATSPKWRRPRTARLDRPDPPRPAAQLVRPHRQRSRLRVRPSAATPPSSPARHLPSSSPGRRRATHRAGATAGASTSSAVDTRASTAGTCGAVMARTWLSIRVDLVEGGGHDSIWPRPGRIRRADSRERGQLPRRLRFGASALAPRRCGPG